jgi:hypothetical protein
LLFKDTEELGKALPALVESQLQRFSLLSWI